MRTHRPASTAGWGRSSVSGGGRGATVVLTAPSSVPRRTRNCLVIPRRPPPPPEQPGPNRRGQGQGARLRDRGAGDAENLSVDVHGVEPAEVVLAERVEGAAA